LYRSDSDESIRRYRLGPLLPRPQSSLSLNQLQFRRRSNPDIYPGTRRFSTSYSDEDILSNDQLDQIHFDPRYRDYRSASSLNNSNYRSRSNSLHSMASTGYMVPQNLHLRRISSISPPTINPLVPQKRWDTNPSIFIEEYCDEEMKSDEKGASKETLNTSNESLQPALNECDIKSFGDLSQIPFIDDDSNDSAPCELPLNVCNNRNNACRKSVSFDVIQNSRHVGPSHKCLFASNGKNFPKNFPPNIKSTHMNNELFHASHSPTRSSRAMRNVRASRDGYVARSHSQQPVVPNNKKSSFSPSTSSSSSVTRHDDHCSLVDKLIRIKKEDRQLEHNNRRVKESLDYKIKWNGIDGKKSTGKVKALTTFFNTLPYMSDECNCINFHQSTPNLSMTRSNNHLSCEEMATVRKQLKEWSEYGLKKSPSKDDNLVCTFMKRATSSPILCLENEIYGDCKQYNNVLNRLDNVRLRRQQNMEYVRNPQLPDGFILTKPHLCHSACKNIENTPIMIRPPSEKHRCRSACFNIKDPAKKRLKKKKAQSVMTVKHASEDDDDETFII
jgi:hypothetical protein